MILLALDPALVFEATEAAYRHGVLDQSLPVLSEALEKLIAANDLNMEDLLTKLDGAQQSTVDKVEFALSHAGPLLKLAKQDWLMKMTAKMFKIAFVRKATAFIMQKGLEMVIARSDGTNVPLSQKIKRLLRREV